MQSALSNDRHDPNAARPARVPSYPGFSLSGELDAFRRDRIGMQLRVARDFPDIAAFRLGFVRAVMIGAPALVHEVFSTKNDAFVKAPGLSTFLRPVLGRGLLTSEHEFHASQRKLIAPAFAHKRVASYAPIMAERADKFVASIRDGEVLDAGDAMMRLTLEIVGKALFDAEVGGDADEIGEALTIAMECTMSQLSSLLPMPPAVPTPANLRLRRAVARLDRVVYRIIRERRSAEDDGQTDDRGDLLSILLSTRDEGGARMPDRQVRDEAMTLLLAGHETTANAMAWTLLLLAENPEARAKVEAEVDALGRAPSYDDLSALPYTLAVLKEAMRIYPPAYLIGRRPTRDVVIGQHRLRQNTLVLINTLGIHRRPDLYEDPESFRPERFLGDAEKKLPRGAYLPFGGGPRVCIGNHFALMEGHVLLATILRRVRFERVDTAPVEMEPLVTLRPRDLRLRAIVR